MKNNFSVTIDGESGGGKSTLACRVAKHFKLNHMNLGAIYRAFTVAVLRAGANPENEAEVLTVLDKTKVDVEFKNGQQQNYLNGELLGTELYENTTSKTVPMLIKYPRVADYLISTQQRIASAFPVIMEGRNCASVILPTADVKIYLTASPEARAERRQKELLERGEKIDKEIIKKELIERDRIDRMYNGNLVKMPDSIVLDSSALNPDEVFEEAIRIISNKVQ